MDIVIPDVDGMETIRQIMRETPTARIIAVTMYRGEQYMLDTIGAGARGYVLKPIVPKFVTALCGAKQVVTAWLIEK